jgi:hypothetical protein
MGHVYFDESELLKGSGRRTVLDGSAFSIVVAQFCDGAGWLLR